MEAFSYPFRFMNGSVVTIDTTTDQYAAQEIASVIQTEIGELLITPTFGIDSPAFDIFDSANLSYNVARHFPDIQLDSITESVAEDGSVKIEVGFTRQVTTSS